MRLASEVVCSTRCIGTEIAEGYVPPASSFAYDYGGAASQLAKGFTLVTPDSDMFVGQVRDFEGLGTGALLYDANSGMTRIVLNVPNGSYVLRLFLPQGGTGQIYELRVNGTTHHVTWNDKGQWPAGSPLVSPANQGGTAAPPIGGYTCKMPMGARVAGGEVVVEFDGQPNPMPISGLELKPYDPLDDELGEDECLLWDAAQRDAVRAYREGGGGQDDDPEVDIPGNCVGDCPVDDPEDPSPSGAT
jgi:hypothetical protein